MDANATSLVIGGEVKTVGLAVAGKLFVFTPHQMQFLLNLQKLKSVHAAAMSISKDEAWAQKFLSSRKFKNYIGNKLQEYSVKSGMTIEWWHQFGKQIADGYKETYKVNCPYCKYEGQMTEYEVEAYRNDDMDLELPCPACLTPATYELKREEFKPSREQVEAWKELGSRLIPKIERIHHQFENAEIVFESDNT
jgi:hypothetical protein